MKQAYFQRNRTSIIIIAVVVLLTIGILIWMGANNKKNDQQSIYATDAEKQALLNSFVQGPTSSDVVKNQFLEKNNVQSTTTVASDAEKQRMLQQFNNK